MSEKYGTRNKQQQQQQKYQIFIREKLEIPATRNGE